MERFTQEVARDDPRALVLYDEDCGFCRWSADRFRMWDRNGRLAFGSIQAADRAGRLDAIPPELRYGSWHLITPDDRIWSSGAAVAPMMRRLPGGRTLAAIADTFPGTTEHAYRFVARHRRRLGAILGQQACAVNPGRARRETSAAEDPGPAVRR